MKVGNAEVMLSGFPASREAIRQASQKDGFHERVPSGLKPDGFQVGRFGGCGWPNRRQLVTRDSRVNRQPRSHQAFLNDNLKTYKKDGKPDGLPVGKVAIRSEGKIAIKLE
ncbi:MAG: hypothetical protein SFV24_17880 [Gemmatimonadales bacterium]|jgi:hypothetical protein|nr:hypothetical protein [Gemmatimonadales bacterium]